MLVSRPSVGRIIPVSQVLRYWGNLGKLGPNPQIMWKARTQVIQSLQFLVSHQIIRPYSSVRRTHGLNYTCFTGTRVLGKFWGNWAQIPQIMCRDTWKVIQSLQLLVSHQMRPYSSVRALCGSSYTCFTGTWILGQFGETRPECPKSCAGTHGK